MTMRRSMAAALTLIGIVGLGTAGYASILGEENVTLVRQLSELMGIHRDTTKLFRDTREGLAIAREMADDARRAQRLVEELHDYTASDFVRDLGDDLLDTYPDLGAILADHSAPGLRQWQQDAMRSPMDSYDLIGRVFWEATREQREEGRATRLPADGPLLYRYEAAASLSAAEDAERFIADTSADLERLVERLDGATEEEAVVLSAKIQALLATQNRHLVRLLSLSLRRQGVDDARRFRSATRQHERRLELEHSLDELDSLFESAPSLMSFGSEELE